MPKIANASHVAEIIVLHRLSIACYTIEKKSDDISAIIDTTGNEDAVDGVANVSNINLRQAMYSVHMGKDPAKWTG